jgi:hypothetical protein
MTIFNGLLIASFLILLAASVAVVASMIVLALFDLAFAKKRTPPAQDTDIESVELNEPVSNLKTEDEGLTSKIVPFKRSA